MHRVNDRRCIAQILRVPNPGASVENSNDLVLRGGGQDTLYFVLKVEFVKYENKLVYLNLCLV